MWTEVINCQFLQKCLSSTYRSREQFMLRKSNLWSTAYPLKKEKKNHYNLRLLKGMMLQEGRNIKEGKLTTSNKLRFPNLTARKSDHLDHCLLNWHYDHLFIVPYQLRKERLHFMTHFTDTEDRMALKGITGDRLMGYI